MLFSGINVYADTWSVEPVRIVSNDGSKILVYNPQFHRFAEAKPADLSRFYGL